MQLSERPLATDYDRISLDWTSIPQLPRISVPTLVYNGEYDTLHDIASVLLFELIPRVRWITFSGAGHMCHLEDEATTEWVSTVVGGFLTQGE